MNTQAAHEVKSNKARREEAEAARAQLVELRTVIELQRAQLVERRAQIVELLSENAEWRALYLDERALHVAITQVRAEK